MIKSVEITKSNSACICDNCFLIINADEKALFVTGNTTNLNEKIILVCLKCAEESTDQKILKALMSLKKSKMEKINNE
jgi:hypothetical protein